MRKLIVASCILSVLGFVTAGQVQAASYPLVAGKTMEAGTVDVTSDGTCIYVTFNTANGWVLDATQVHLAGSLADIPQTRSGNPIPGQFLDQHENLVAADSDTYVFPIGDFGGEDVYVAAHAVVARLNGQRLQVEGAWAGTGDFPGKNWAKYIAIPGTQWVASGSELDISGDWTFMLFDGFYRHDLTIAQGANGIITGAGALMAGTPPHPAQYVTLSGQVAEDAVTITILYTNSSGFVAMLVGTIAEDGSISGTGSTVINGTPIDTWDWWSISGTVETTGGAWTLP